MFSKGVALPNCAEAGREFLLLSRTCQLQLFSSRLGDQKGPNLPAAHPWDASNLLGFTHLKKAQWRRSLCKETQFSRPSKNIILHHKSSVISSYTFCPRQGSGTGKYWKTEGLGRFRPVICLEENASPCWSGWLFPFPSASCLPSSCYCSLEAAGLAVHLCAR